MGDSASRGAAGRLAEPVWFIDRNLGKYTTPKALRDGGWHVETYAEHFVKEDEPDQVWIAFAAARRWICLTKDGELKNNALERRAILDNDAHVFSLTRRDASGLLQAQAFLMAGPRMVSLSTLRVGTPLYARVSMAGRVEEVGL